MANKYVLKISSQEVGEMQINIQMRYYFTPIVLANFKKMCKCI